MTGPERARRDVRGNPFGVAGLMVAAAAIVVGVFSFRASLAIAIVAVLLSAVGLYWWRLYGVGRTPSAAGLAIGGIAALIAAYFAANGM